MTATPRSGPRSGATKTVVYGIDGNPYAFDRNEVNPFELRHALAPYLSVSRRLGELPRPVADADPADEVER